VDAVKFTEWIRNPEKVHEIDSAELKRIAHQYPYSQSIQLLYAIRLKNSSEHLFQQQLGRASILTTDRTVLFDLFEGTSQTIAPPKLKNGPEKEGIENSGVAEDPIKEPVQEKETAVPPSEYKEQEVERVEKKQQENDHKRVVKDQEKKEVLAKPKQATVEEDFSKLSASERIKAILEKSRKIQKEFDSNKKPEDEANERVKAIRDKLQEIKEKNRKEDQPSIEEEVPVVEETQEPLAETLKEEKGQEDVSENLENDLRDSPDLSTEEKLDLTQNLVIEAEEQISENTNLQEEEVEALEPTIEKEEAEFAPVFTIDEEERLESEEEVTPISEDEEHSFSGWLNRLKSEGNKKTGETEEEVIKEEPVTIDKKLKLFDSFVEKLPEIKKKGLESSTKTSTIPVQPPQNSGSLVTETLAKVYIQQGHFDKAIKAYQILQLKYPEKNGFFADRILEIKKLKNNK
jgi:hypothetical protein